MKKRCRFYSKVRNAIQKLQHRQWLGEFKLDDTNELKEVTAVKKVIKIFNEFTSNQIFGENLDVFQFQKKHIHWGTSYRNKKTYTVSQRDTLSQRF
jgi:hypothetical protein